VDRNRAAELDETIERMARGESVRNGMASYVATIRQVQELGSPVPPAPHRLAPGRQRLLAEAARLRTESSGRRVRERGFGGAMKLATALIALVLVSGLVFGAGRAMADSLPGDALYGAKLTVEGWRSALTRDAAARAELDLRLAESRMDEVDALLKQSREVNEPIAARVEQQLETALATAAGQADDAAAGTLQQLALAIRQRQQTMEQLAGESPQQAVRQLMQVMERVRTEAHAGASDPAGLRERLRQGTLGAPGGGPGAGPGPGPQPTAEPGAEVGPGPQATGEPGAGPGPESTAEPDAGSGPQQPMMEPGGGLGPGMKATTEAGAGMGKGAGSGGDHKP
jgi:hypothetical protein